MPNLIVEGAVSPYLAPPANDSRECVPHGIRVYAAMCLSHMRICTHARYALAASSSYSSIQYRADDESITDTGRLCFEREKSRAHACEATRSRLALGLPCMIYVLCTSLNMPAIMRITENPCANVNIEYARGIRLFIYQFNTLAASSMHSFAVCRSRGNQNNALSRWQLHIRTRRRRITARCVVCFSPDRICIFVVPRFWKRVY